MNKIILSLPKYWYTDKTEKTLDLLLKAYKMNELYDSLESEVDNYKADSQYPYIGFEHGEFNINQKCCFEEDFEYISSEKLIELFSSFLASIPEILKLSTEPILETAVTYATQSKTTVESNISQITETREQPKSFFNF